MFVTDIICGRPGNAVELAHAEYANGDPAYDRSPNAFRAYCVSYMLCRKNGIDTKDYDFSRLPDTFAGMGAQDIRGELSAIRDTAADISARMAKVLEQGKAEAIEAMNDRLLADLAKVGNT